MELQLLGVDHCELYSQKIEKKMPIDENAAMDLMQRTITHADKLSKPIKSLLPKVDGKLVLDVHYVGDKELAVTYMLVRSYTILDDAKKKWSQMGFAPALDFNKVISDSILILKLFPKRVNHVGATTCEMHILLHMGIPLYNIGKRCAAMVIYRGLAAMIRLSLHNRDVVHISQYEQDTYVHSVMQILDILVAHKMRRNAHRPFFSRTRIDCIEEEELGIGIYSEGKYKCNECGVGRDCVCLSKCNGCKRVWYCSKECNKNTWSRHKLVCQTTWRAKEREMVSGKEYNAIKARIAANSQIFYFYENEKESHKIICRDVLPTDRPSNRSGGMLELKSGAVLSSLILYIKLLSQGSYYLA